MSSSSPLAAIHHVIQQVRASATADASLFQSNEAATRAALIDPILRALGWDTTNVRLVEPERMVANKQKLDYLLKDFQGKIRSVVEAKKLGESLDKLGHVGALIGYAFSLKPKNFFITDGLNWHYYSPAHSSYEPVETLNLQEANPIEAALQLIQWLDAAHSGHGIQEMNTRPLTSPRKSLPTVVVLEKSAKSVAISASNRMRSATGKTLICRSYSSSVASAVMVDTPSHIGSILPYLLPPLTRTPASMLRCRVMSAAPPESDEDSPCA